MRTLAERLGLLLVAVGVGLWSLPAGLVVGGVLLVVAANYSGAPDAAEEPDEGGVRG